jgi:hypothetical protein
LALGKDWDWQPLSPATPAATPGGGGSSGNPRVSLPPCWKLQCSRCRESYLGNPTLGHQCYRQMTVDTDFCFDPDTQSECDREPNPLIRGRTVFFAVQPKFRNVDIRITVDVTVGNLDVFLTSKEDTFVVDVNKTNGVHNVSLTLFTCMKSFSDDMGHSGDEVFKLLISFSSFKFFKFFLIF